MCKPQWVWLQWVYNATLAGHWVHGPTYIQINLDDLRSPTDRFSQSLIHLLPRLVILSNITVTTTYFNDRSIREYYDPILLRFRCSVVVVFIAVTS